VSAPAQHDRIGRMTVVASRWGPAVAWMALIFILSAQPGLRISNDASVDTPIRHVAHVVAFGVLAVLFLRAFGVTRDAWFARGALLAVVLTVLYGITDEIHQSTVPSRHGQAIDVAWDGIGALAGVALAWLLVRRRRRPDQGRI
jgi:VanZ family protein